MLDDSVGARSIGRSGSSVDQQNRDLVLLILVFAAVFRINLYWAGGLPSMRTGGDPFSRLDKELFPAKELVDKLKATHMS